MFLVMKNVTKGTTNMTKIIRCENYHLSTMNMIYSTEKVIEICKISLRYENVIRVQKGYEKIN